MWSTHLKGLPVADNDTILETSILISGVRTSVSLSHSCMPGHPQRGQRFDLLFQGRAASFTLGDITLGDAMEISNLGQNLVRLMAREATGADVARMDARDARRTSRGK
jgi:hypothetical protein